MIIITETTRMRINITDPTIIMVKRSLSLNIPIIINVIIIIRMSINMSIHIVYFGFTFITIIKL